MPDATKYDEAACLDYYPFSGEFGTPGDKILSDRIVTARKPLSSPCAYCGGNIEPETRTRKMAAVFDGSFHAYRWCSDCCAAMAKSWQDGGAALTRRINGG